MHSKVKHHIARAAHSFRRYFIEIGVVCMGLLLLLAGGLALYSTTLTLPDLSSLQNQIVYQSLKIYDRTGSTLLYDLNKDIQRTVVPLSQISPNIQHATISIEDPEFYHHIGIRPTAILRALLNQVTGGVGGGSTITQQVVKNTILTSDKTYTRKFKEWILAVKLTQAYTKDEVLALYLNQIPFGGSVYGAEEASETFFGKHASDVDIAEAAYLAAVLPAPSYYSPYGTHKDKLDTRKDVVITQMVKYGYITEEEATKAKAEKVVFKVKKDSSISAPHFVFYVEQYLTDKYGEDALTENGWKVTTTLDADLQVKAEETVRAGALANVDKYNASNAALIAINPKNGDILSMVGSRNYFDTAIDGAYNVATQQPGRQPGSTFKPFAYAEAFTKGYTPETVLFDLPTQFSTSCDANNFSNTTPCYSPVNYDGLFRGPMTLRNALAQSINVPAVETLYLAGIDDTLTLAKAMGVNLAGDKAQYGLTLVLGGGEVTLLDMTSAYGVFANNGVRVSPRAVLKIEDQNGKIIEDNSQDSGTRILSQQVAEQINDILSDKVARAPLGENDLFVFPGHDVAVKTGTTNNYRDAWTIGYTPNIAIGIWAGNNDNTPMEKRVSGFIVGPMWHDVMQYALARTDSSAFTRTPLDTSNLKPILRGVWQGNQITNINGTQYVTQNVHSILYWLNKADPLGSSQPNFQDSQFNLWETPVRNWAATNGLQDGILVPVTNASQ